MKREDIAKLFENATDEQISALLDINSQDIGKAKRGSEKLQADLDAADAAALQQQIDAYKQAEAERAEAEKQAREEAELEARFSAVVGDKTFIHDMVREGVKRDFGAALKDKQYLGKGDAEIFAALTKDKDYFASQNPVGNPFPKMGDPNPLKVADKAAFFKLSFADQMRFKKENAAQFEQMFRQPPRPTN